MHIEGSRGSGRRLISLTPLIDVVFILLLFFMLTSQFDQQRTLVMDVPRSQTDSGVNDAELISLDLRGSGELVIDGEITTTIDNMSTSKRLLTARENTLPIDVTPDDDVDLQTLIRLLDGLEAMGFERVSLGGL
jgi:biopolymer transport protein ExbD